VPFYFFNVDYKNKYGDITTIYGTGIFSKYPLIDSGKVVYTGKKVPESLAFADIKIGNDTLRVFNTHFQSMYLKLQITPDTFKDDFIVNDYDFLKNNTHFYQRLKHYDARHALQAEIVKPVLNNSKFPFIFCADLNSVPSSYAYHTISAGLTDAFIAKGFGLGGTYDGFSPTVRIDVVLMSKQLKPIQYYSPRLHASDHFPIITDIQLH
jgi:endonuclease/exonuclease/phosphatase family metal-dependent hydrolase